MTSSSFVFSNFSESKLGTGIGIVFDFLHPGFALTGVVSTSLTKVFLVSSTRSIALTLGPRLCEVSVLVWCEYLTCFDCQFLGVDPPDGGGFDDGVMILPSTTGSCSATWCCLPHAFGVLVALFITNLLHVKSLNWHSDRS